MSKESNDNGTIRVMVYGTLKRGHGNHRALEGAEFLGREVIHGDFTMLDMGWYPGVVRAKVGDSEGRVVGEVYRVNEDHLFTMDLIEGHPTFYERIRVKTRWKNTWLYTLPADYAKSRPTIIADGLWKPSPEELEFVKSCQS